MKPTSKIQQLVYDMHLKLPVISRKQDEWLLHAINRYYALKTKHTANCFECGHQWKVETNLISQLGLECPQCGKELIISDKKAWKRKDFVYCRIATTYNGFQVLRYFHVERNCRKGKPANYWYQEVYQHWFSPNGNHVIISKNVNAFGFYDEHPKWIHHSDMSIKKENDRYYWSSICYPQKRYIPELKRNGFNGSYYGYSPAYFFELLLKYPAFETLLKSKQIELLRSFTKFENQIKELWPLMKICIRNNYIVDNATIWLDHINLLHHLNLDVRSPKYICPKDLYGEHQILIKRKQRIEREKRLAEIKSKIEEDDKLYQKEKGKFFELQLTHNDLNIVPLKSVHEFFDEGYELKHCLFENKYHRKKDSLILSARVNNVRMETIEVDLKGLRVNQSYGLNNQTTPYHDLIVDIVNNNMNQIIKLLRTKKKVA